MSENVMNETFALLTDITARSTDQISGLYIQIQNLKNSISTVFNYKGTKDSLSDLDNLTNKHVGDVWQIGNDEYVYNGTTWELLGPAVNFTPIQNSIDNLSTYTIDKIQFVQDNLEAELSAYTIDKIELSGTCTSGNIPVFVNDKKLKDSEKKFGENDLGIFIQNDHLKSNIIQQLGITNSNFDIHIGKGQRFIAHGVPLIDCDYINIVSLSGQEICLVPGFPDDTIWESYNTTLYDTFEYSTANGICSAQILTGSLISGGIISQAGEDISTHTTIGSTYTEFQIKTLNDNIIHTFGIGCSAKDNIIPNEKAIVNEIKNKLNNSAFNYHVNNNDINHIHIDTYSKNLYDEYNERINNLATKFTSIIADHEDEVIISNNESGLNLSGKKIGGDTLSTIVTDLGFENDFQQKLNLSFNPTVTLITTENYMTYSYGQPYMSGTLLEYKLHSTNYSNTFGYIRALFNPSTGTFLGRVSNSRYLQVNAWTYSERTTIIDGDNEWYVNYSKFPTSITMDDFKTNFNVWFYDQPNQNTSEGTIVCNINRNITTQYCDSLIATEKAVADYAPSKAYVNQKYNQLYTVLTGLIQVMNEKGLLSGTTIQLDHLTDEINDINYQNFDDLL